MRTAWGVVVVAALGLVACGEGAMRECSPEAVGPHWLQEGEALEAKVPCPAGRVDGSALTVVGLPAGASYDAATATLRWRPGLDQAGTYALTVSDASGHATSLTVGVADAWDAPDNVPVDPVLYTEEFGLPVIHLSSSIPLNPDVYEPATVTYRGHVYTAEARIRGAASLGFPKNSYTLKFSKLDPFSEPEREGGMLARRSIVLVNTFNDNSYIRPRLAFELWRRLDPGHLQLKAFSVVVYRDGQYVGVYTLTDHVDEHLMAAHGLSKDGNLYKAETSDTNFRLVKDDGTPKSSPHSGYEKKEGLPEEGQPGAFDDLDAFVTFVATASQDDFRTAASSGLFDARDYGDWWILAVLALAQDADKKNSYHYHDPTGGPWRYAPWDMDGTFGQAWKTARRTPAAEVDAGGGNEMFRRLLVDPTLGPALRERLREAMRGRLNAFTVCHLVHTYADEVRASALRDQAKWQAAYRSYPVWSDRTDWTTFDQEVDYVCRWVLQRWAFVGHSLE